MATVDRDIRSIELTEDELWEDGPPHEVFKRMRAECPIHWTEQFSSDFPDEAGFWSVTTADDVHTVSRDWRTYSSEVGGITAGGVLPMELSRAMFIGMDPPKHDRVKALFQAGFTPKRIADHEERIREIVADVLDRLDGRETLRPRHRRRPARRRARDRQLHGHLRGGRRDLGRADERDARRRRRGPQPRGHRRDHGEARPRDLRALRQADRRAPREPHRRPHQRARARRGRRRETRGTRDRDGLLPADGRRQRLDQGDLLQRHARADGRRGAASRCCSRTPRWSPTRSRSRCACSPRSRTSAAPRPATPSSTARRSRRARRSSCGTSPPTATRRRYEDPDRFDLRRKAEHQAFGAGGRHFCLGTALARLELRILIEETLAALPADRARRRRPSTSESPFINQLKTLPVKLGAPAPA